MVNHYWCHGLPFSNDCRTCIPFIIPFDCTISLLNNYHVLITALHELQLLTTTDPYCYHLLTSTITIYYHILTSTINHYNHYVVVPLYSSCLCTAGIELRVQQQLVSAVQEGLRTPGGAPYVGPRRSRKGVVSPGPEFCGGCLWL